MIRLGSPTTLLMLIFLMSSSLSIPTLAQTSIEFQPSAFLVPVSPGSATVRILVHNVPAEGLKGFSVTFLIDPPQVVAFSRFTASQDIDTYWTNGYTTGPIYDLNAGTLTLFGRSNLSSGGPSGTVVLGDVVFDGSASPSTGQFIWDTQHTFIATHSPFQDDALQSYSNATVSVMPLRSAADRVEMLLAGLSIGFDCNLLQQSCVLGDPNGLHAPLDTADGPYIDAQGRSYRSIQAEGDRCSPCSPMDSYLVRANLSGEFEQVIAFRTACEGTFAYAATIEQVHLNMADGSVLLMVSNQVREIVPGPGCGEGHSWREWIEFNGLPGLLDVVPEGPPGPEGPSGAQGAQGPPGPLLTPCPDADADAFRDCVTIPGCFPYGGACGDCNDADPTINPRGSETTPKANRHDGKDNNCNGVIDG